MENAGRAASEHILARLAGSGGPVAILCGGGNNGGDGYVVARHLSIAGVRVELFSTVPAGKLRGDARLNREIVDRMGLSVSGDARSLGDAALYVDALFGTGFAGEVRPDLVRWIEALNLASERSAAPVVALDLPSGLDCDLGTPANACVRADLTVTFVARKAGMALPESEAWTGEVVVAGIGAPEAAIRAALTEIPSANDPLTDA